MSSGTTGASPKLTDPVQFLAFGFGSGLSPKAPGTAGTVAAIPIYLLMATLPLWQYSALVVLGAVIGVFICDHASRALGVRSPSST